MDPVYFYFNLFSEGEPMRDDLLDMIYGNKPSILDRKNVSERILNRIKSFVERFIEGMAGK